MSRWNATERTLIALAVTGALVWLVAEVATDGRAGGPLLAAKAAPATLLAALAAGRHPRARGGLLALALALHAAGDVLLERTLLAGLAAFLLGHLVYLALFWPARRPLEATGGAAKLGLGLLALTGALYLALLAGPLAGASAVAVPLYVVALVCMAGSALLAGRGQPLVGAGGLLFVASDALLAVELFLDGAGRLRPLVWPLYVGAQLALALGWLGAGPEAPAAPDAAAGGGPDRRAARARAEAG